MQLCMLFAARPLWTGIRLTDLKETQEPREVRWWRSVHLLYCYKERYLVNAGPANKEPIGVGVKELGLSQQAFRGY